MATTKAQQKAVNKYRQKNYDLIQITMPKGEKEKIKAHAESKGESVNGFINQAIKTSIDGIQGEKFQGNGSEGHGAEGHGSEGYNGIQSNGAEGRGAVMVSTGTLDKVNVHIEKTQETQTGFVERAITDTIDRDNFLLRMKRDKPKE